MDYYNSEQEDDFGEDDNDSDAGMFLDLMQEVDVRPTLYKTNREEEVKLMIEADVSQADIFYEVNNKMMKSKSQLIEEQKYQEASDIEENFNSLQDYGFRTRISDSSDWTSGDSLLKSAAKQIITEFDLNKSQEQQLKELKMLRKKQRSGLMKLVPDGMYKYIDYLKSLEKKPKKKDLLLNVGIAAFFAFVTAANSRVRSSVMYWGLGNMAMISSLVTRGMTVTKPLPGMEGGRRRAGSWSKNAFRTAVAITFLYTISSALAFGVLLAPFPLGDGKLKLTAILSLISSGYFTAGYECFEKKGENGWRWKRSMEGLLSNDEQLKANEKDITTLKDKYDYDYEPDVDDYPPQPKYQDEVEPEDPNTQGSTDLQDEGEALKHFDDWKEMLKDRRRPPVEDVQPEEPWVGGKVGMYVEKIPSWVQNAYKRNVLNANSWRDKPSKYKKDYDPEFVAYDGPLGFRDKSPKWIDQFSAGVWEEKVTVSRRAARAFGTYRKAMRLIDNEVVLLPCDE